jgi:hypothetical protein
MLALYPLIMICYDKLYYFINENEKLQLTQEKWYIDLIGGRIITVPEEKYTLMATENKRKLIYVNNKLVNTLPYTLINDKLV